MSLGWEYMRMLWSECVNLRTDWSGRWSVWHGLVHFSQNKISHQSPVLILLVSYERHWAAHHLIDTHRDCLPRILRIFHKFILKAACFYRCYLYDVISTIFTMQCFYSAYIKTPENLRAYVHPHTVPAGEKEQMMTLCIPLKASAHTDNTAQSKQGIQQCKTLIFGLVSSTVLIEKPLTAN